MLMVQHRQPTLYLPHGAGPSFFVDFGPFPQSDWARTCDFLSGIAATLPARPDAIVAISSHWETAVPSVNVAERHTMLYDYHGGSPESYRLRYPASGAPAVADQVETLLAKSGSPVRREASRGLDHGVFAPLMLVFPDADVPVVPVSLPTDADAAVPLALGEALAPLRDQNVLIVGSGMSFHNGAVMPNGLKGIDDPGSDRFDAWLVAAVAADRPRRNAALAHWRDAPDARHAHPAQEHLTPLHVVAGAAGDDRGQHIFSDRFLGATFSAFRFG